MELPGRMTYRGDVDSASSQPGDLVLSLETAGLGTSVPEGIEIAAGPEQSGLAEGLFEELWLKAEGQDCGLTRMEFEAALAAVGKKCNYGLRPQAHPDMLQKEAFFRALHLQDLAMAQACALGRDVAWQRFLSQYRSAVTQAAIAITRSATVGNDLADSLYAELFGLKEKDGQRNSPLASYSGRGSLLSWLRTTLAQRHCDHHRRTSRETPLESIEPPAAAPQATARQDELNLLAGAVAKTLKALEPEDRFLLASYFLDRRTLMDIARLLKVHEATVSRKLRRLVDDVHKLLLSTLQAAGSSERKAQETLGIDPRDIEINLRRLLQTSETRTFPGKTRQSELDSK
jgi:RNA polymerase sigma-70 factor, ECF subfamily